MIVEAFQGEASRLRMDGVQFRHVGQAFQQRCSALTVAGNARMAGEMAALEVGRNVNLFLPKAGADALKSLLSSRVS